MKVILDSNVTRQVAASAYVHVCDDVLLWGDLIAGTRRYQYRFRPPRSPEIAAEVAYIPALAIEGKQRGIGFFQTQFQKYEVWHMKPAIDWARRSIDALFSPDILRHDTDYSGLIAGRGFDLKAAMRRHIVAIPSDRLRHLIAAMGPKSSQDAYHLWIAEECGIDAIVTLDLKWLRRERANRLSSVRVISPAQLCRELNIEAYGARWFEEEDHGFNNRIEFLFERRASRLDKFLYRLICVLQAINRRTRSNAVLKFKI